jgi:PAS domain S-box-containing protein
VKRGARAAPNRGRTPEQAGAELSRLRDEVDRLRSSEGTPRGPASLRHEISVYQEELVIQNESLRSAQSALEETRDRFIKLYDFAPTGYLTLDGHGVIRECNLTAAAMMGKSKAALEGATLLGIVHPTDRSSLIRFLRRCRSNREPQTEAEFLIRTANGPRHVQFLCRGRSEEQGPPSEFFASMIDVTERRQLEHERGQMAEERAALAGRLLSAQEDERRRIAVNLHDDVGQQATALRLTLERLLADPAAGNVRTRLVELQAALARLDESLHLISAGLRPSALDLGLVPAVRQLVYDWSASSGIAASLDADEVEQGWLAPDVETQVFRILQEALTNVAKHSGASRVTIVLKRAAGGIELTVEDNGRGFDVDAVRAAKTGLGLIGMRERVQIIGGRLNIKRGDAQGTVVSVTAPRTL